MGKFFMLTVHELVMYPYKQTLICDGAHNKAVTFFTLEQSIDHKQRRQGKGRPGNVFDNSDRFPSHWCAVSVPLMVVWRRIRAEEGIHSFIHSFWMTRLVCTTT